jgi:hypothetical protein
MKVADWLVRGLVVLTFLALLVSPEKWGSSMGLICSAAMGVWAILYPAGVLGWAKTAHPNLDVEDRSIWWVPRLIGTCFVAVVLWIAVALLSR